MDLTFSDLCCEIKKITPHFCTLAQESKNVFSGTPPLEPPMPLFLFLVFFFNIIIVIMAIRGDAYGGKFNTHFEFVKYGLVKP